MFAVLDKELPYLLFSPHSINKDNGFCLNRINQLFCYHSLYNFFISFRPGNSELSATNKKLIVPLCWRHFHGLLPLSCFCSFYRKSFRLRRSFILDYTYFNKYMWGTYAYILGIQRNGCMQDCAHPSIWQQLEFGANGLKAITCMASSHLKMLGNKIAASGKEAVTALRAIADSRGRTKKIAIVV